ncbi:MAG: hypothetical protein WA434_01120, partial [Candidatus Acidiferrales bacterium]
VNPPACFGTGFFFAVLGGCSTTVPAVCTNAAAAEPVNSSVPGSSGLASLAANGCYVSPNGKSVIIPPAQGTFGNMRPGSLIGPGFHEWDLSVRKNFKVNERIGFEFSFSAFNVLNNHARALGFFGGVVNLPGIFSFGLATGQPNDSNLLNGTGGARLISLGLKATF